MNCRLLLTAITLILLLGSCGGKQEETSVPDDATLLYHNILTLISEYSDSISHTTDSLTTQEMLTRFNSKLDSLNFAVPSDTDLELSEGENDTIFQQIENLRRIYDSQLKGMAKTEPDTCQQSTTL